MLTVVGSAMSLLRHWLPGRPAEARVRAATALSMKGTGARKLPICSQISSRSSSDGPPPPRVSETPTVGPAIWQKAAHRPGSKPPGSLARTTSGGQRSVRKARTAETRSCCSSVRFRSMVEVRHQSEGPGR